MQHRTAQREVPRVPGHPLLGNLPEIRRDRASFLIRVAERHGDLARIRAGFFLRGVVVSEPELAREVLVEKDDAFIKGLGLSLFGKPLLGEGLLTSEHEVHRRQRRMMAPAFMPRRIADYADAIAACADQSAERLARADRADVGPEMMRLALDAAGRTMFRSDLTRDAAEIYTALTRTLEYVNGQISSVFPLPPSIPSPANLRVKRIIRRLDEVVYRLIRERRAMGGDTGDLLSMLLLAQDQDGSRMTDQQVRDETMTILLAGHETTANALSWALYLLAHHPDVRERLEEEVDQVLGGRRPDLASLPRLPWTLQVFKEAMRLYPPAYLVVRRAISEVTLGGHTVLPGETVMINIIGMHRRADYFADPLRFQPERFAPEAEKALPRHAYLPFSLGPRICIGNHFALMEGQIALAHLVQTLRFDLLPGRERAEPESLLTLRPRGGLPMRVTRRERLGVPRTDERPTAAAAP